VKPSDFVALVAKMRASQKAFFQASKGLSKPDLTPAQKGELETKKRASLAESKRLESEVDREIKAQRQPSLFGEDGDA
jgi:hypothetical protein